MDVKEEDILGDKVYSHWYYVAKGRALRQFISNCNISQILDVGAGSGVFSRQLLEQPHCQSAVCVDPNYAREYSETHGGKPIDFVHKVEGKTFPMILMMDVLEHVQDDVALLKDYAKAMDRDGHILITVPAFQFLWSGHDVFLEHYRRYHRDMLADVVQKAGLEVVRMRYFFGLLFPLVACMRLIRHALLRSGQMLPKSDLSVAPAWLNRLLITVHDAERVMLFPANQWAGLSLFCLCRTVSPVSGKGQFRMRLKIMIIKKYKHLT